MIITQVILRTQAIKFFLGLTEAPLYSSYYNRLDVPTPQVRLYQKDKFLQWKLIKEVKARNGRERKFAYTSKGKKARLLLGELMALMEKAEQ